MSNEFLRDLEEFAEKDNNFILAEPPPICIYKKKKKSIEEAPLEDLDEDCKLDFIAIKKRR